MNRNIIIALSVVIVLGAAYFLLRGSPDDPTDPATEVASDECIDIGYSRLRISLPVFVAQEKRMFENVGLNVCLEQYDTAQPLMQALIEGEIDIAGYTALPITYNGMIRSGKKLRFVSAMVEDQEHRISYMLVSADSDIDNLDDLTGKRIGILPTIAYQKWAEAILTDAGVDLSTVIIQQIAPNLQPQTLQSGGVDALFTNDPAATTAIQLGVARELNDLVEVPAVFGEPFIFGSFNVSDDWANANPEKYNALVKAIDNAIAFTNSHPDEAKEAMKPYLPEAFQPHVQSYPDALYFSTDQVTQTMFDETVETYLELGMIPGPLSLDGLIATTGSE